MDVSSRNDSSKKEWPELGRLVADAQTRIFLKLVFDIWQTLEHHNQYFVNGDPTADIPSGGSTNRVSLSRSIP